MKTMDISIPYYEDMSRYSNSDIGYFLKYGPKSLKDYKNGGGNRLEGSFLDTGTMIHEYILQPEEFWKDYVILDFEVPKVKQQKDFCEAYAASLELLEDDKKLTAYRSSYSNNKSPEIVLKEASELCNKYASYIEALKQQNDNRKVISGADLTMLKRIKDNLDEHKKARELLDDLLYDDANNEFHINWVFKDVPCKSLLDRVIFDHIKKKIILIDLKTTSDVWNFKHSVEEFDYYRQITYYLLAITWYMKDCGIDISDYDSEAYIIAIQTNGNNEVRVFDMFDEQEILDRKDTITYALSEISYHISSGNWDHSRNYYEGDGVEKL
jgi:hypothetical protein